ncbi:Unknown protein sequence [Pseudomonas syringae pv. syringae]|nr:Unknown protein sequence [Pseudomonas syringae pv. syringae]
MKWQTTIADSAAQGADDCSAPVHAVFSRGSARRDYCWPIP